MPKLRSPLLGLDASGPLGKNLTFSRVKGQTIAKRSPTHADARTLPQLYQRFRYYDGLQYWYSLTPAQQAAYHTTARPHHLTGFQYLMKLYLTNPLDQVLWLRLDTQDPATMPDFSGKGNDGTIIGTTRVPGVIDYARLFDGVNDQINCGSDTTLDIGTGPLTLMAWLHHPLAIPGQECAIHKFAVGYYAFLISAAGAAEFVLYDGVNNPSLGVAGLFPSTAYHHLAGVRNPDTGKIYLYLDGDYHSERVDTSGDLNNAAGDFKVGHNLWWNWLKANADDIRLYTRPLSPGHIKYIATEEVHPPSS